MPWDSIVGHDHARQRFQRAFERNRLASTYLLVGPEGVGKRTFAIELAKAMLCESPDRDASLESCGQCSSCLQVDQQSHPDLIRIRKPADKSILPVELFIGRKEHRRKEGLVYEIGMKPFRGGYRIAIIEDADFFNQESANSLLKTLEEPPPRTLLLLLGTSQQRQLQTIVSRSQVVRFEPLTPSQLEQVLSRPGVFNGEDLDSGQSAALSLAAAGSVSRAIQLADPEITEFRHRLFQQLASGDPHAGEFTKATTEFAEAAGKEGYRKRPRLQLVGDFAIEFFREVAWLVASESSPATDAALVDSATRLAARISNANVDDSQAIVNCLERTVDMQGHVAANVGFPNLVDSWLIDLGRLLRGEVVTTGQRLTGIM